MAQKRSPDKATPAWRAAGVLLFALGTTLAPAAQAGLGEPIDSVQRDHVALHGTALSVTPLPAYDVHETTTVDGARVRQYVSKGGTVFAVAWSAPSLPDLSVVLARHFDDYVAAATAHHGNHHVLTIATPQLVLSVVKHPRGFTGSAHLPALLPAGVSATDLR